MHARRLVLALVVACAVSCALPLSAGVATAGERAQLPPSSRRALVAIFAPKVKPFGLRVTRAALVNPRQERDARGTHLAIYVEPTGAYTPQDYIEGTVDVSKVFLPFVFEKWKGLKSFDVCQEPHPEVDNRPAPAPETQLYATRAGSNLVDWPTVDVATLVERSNTEELATRADHPARFSLFVAKHLEITPAYQQAVGTTTSSTPTTTPTARGYG